MKKFPVLTIVFAACLFLYSLLNLLGFKTGTSIPYVTWIETVKVGYYGVVFDKHYTEIRQVYDKPQIIVVNPFTEDLVLYEKPDMMRFLEIPMSRGNVADERAR